ncbi:hypothetical protein CB1_000327026 [Camelus ferus]|nr:hypothetical protein CB1_000327026 [Camelus ferus]
MYGRATACYVMSPDDCVINWMPSDEAAGSTCSLSEGPSDPGSGSTPPTPSSLKALSALRAGSTFNLTPVNDGFRNERRRNQHFCGRWSHAPCCCGLESLPFPSKKANGRLMQLRKKSRPNHIQVSSAVIALFTATETSGLDAHIRLAVCLVLMGRTSRDCPPGSCKSSWLCAELLLSFGQYGHLLSISQDSFQVPGASVPTADTVSLSA